MNLLANQLATMKSTSARQTFKAKEVKDPEPFAGPRPTLSGSKTSYPLSWPMGAALRTANSG